MNKEKWSENKDIKQIQWLCFTAIGFLGGYIACLLYTSDAADELTDV